MHAHESKYCWEGLVEHIPALRRELERRSRRQDEVEDLLQETLLRAARFRHKLRDPRAIKGWLRQIARSVLSEHLRMRSRALPVSAADDVLELLPSREYEPGTRSVTESMVICGRPVLREQLLERLQEVFGGLRGSDQRLLARRYGLLCVAESSPAAGARNKDQMFRARRRIQRGLHDRMPELLEAAERETFVEENA